MKKLCLVATIPAIGVLLLLLITFAGLARLASMIAGFIAYLIVNIVSWQDSAMLLRLLSTTRNKQHTQRNTNEPTRQNSQELDD